MRLLPVVVMALLAGGASSADLNTELRKLDAFASDPDAKFVLTATMAEHLAVHKNRITLIRMETGQRYSSIAVERLRMRGQDEDGVLKSVQRINADVDRRLNRTGGRAFAPTAYITMTRDSSSAGTIYTVLPEVGIQSRRVSLLAAIPVYRLAGLDQSATGVGDAQFTAIMRHSWERLAVSGSASLGVPTGNRARGLGAGRATYDTAGTLSWRFDRLHAFGTAGLTDSVFRNVGYQRPYITLGSAAYGSAGIERTFKRRFGFGAGVFALKTSGSQTRIDVMSGSAMGSNATPGTHGAGAMDMGSAGRSMQSATETMMKGGQLSDRGPNAWAWHAFPQGVEISVTAARSVPLHLTTVRFGVGINVLGVARRLW